MAKNSFWFKVSIGILSLIILFSGCSNIVAPPEQFDYGLNKVEMSISSEFLSILNGNIYNRRDVPGEVTINDTTYSVLIRYSGQTSINRPKKSYNFEFLHGKRFRGHREYKLSAQTGDPSALRPMAGSYAFRRAGLDAPAIQAAVLYLNREFQGLYFLIEPIDRDFFELRGQQFSTLYKAEGSRARFTYAGGYDVRAGFENEGEKEDYYGDLEHLIAILDESTLEELPERIERLLDVENYLRYLAASVLLHNWDGYFNNFHMHLNLDIGRYQFIPWDYDHLFEFHPERSTIWGANNLSKRLLQVPCYRKRYREILMDFLDRDLAVDELNQRIDEITAQLKDAYHADRFLPSFGVAITTHAGELKEFNRNWFEKIRADLKLLESDCR